MSGFNVTPGLPGIDVSGIKNQSYHDPMAGNSKFNSIMDKVGMGLSAMGPALGAGLQFGGFHKGAAVTSAAIMGFNGGSGMTTPGMSSPKFIGYGAASGTSAKFLGGMPGTAPGYTGGAGGVGTAPGFSGTSTAGFGGANAVGGTQNSGQFDNQINDMMNNNMMFLAMQSKVQNVSQITQMTSNIAKTDSDAKLNAIRNIRS